MKTSMLFSTFPFITSERVTLSRMMETDAKSLWEVMSDDENYRYNPDGALRTIEDVILKIQQIDSIFQEEKAVVLGIYANDNLNKLLGFFEIADINTEIDCVTIGFMVNRSYTGRGYATAAVDAAGKYLFEKVRVNRIQAYVMPTNTRSEQLMAHCGFIKEGVIREGFLWPDKGLVDLSLYSMLKSDYMKRKKGDEPFTRHNIVF